MGTWATINCVHSWPTCCRVDFCDNIALHTDRNANKTKSKPKQNRKPINRLESDELLLLNVAPFKIIIIIRRTCVSVCVCKTTAHTMIFFSSVYTVACIIYITTLIIIIIIVAELDRVQSTKTISRLYTHASEIYYSYIIIHVVDLGRFRNCDRTGRKHDNNIIAFHIYFYIFYIVRDDYFSIILLWCSSARSGAWYAWLIIIIIIIYICNITDYYIKIYKCKYNMAAPLVSRDCARGAV